MTKLNEKNEKTKRIVHLMVTSKCDRNCKHCCNKQYALTDVAVASKEDYLDAKQIFLTGGEPFAYTDPCEIAKQLKTEYPNIEKIMVYTNAYELAEYLKNHELHDIDGLTISIKTKRDQTCFEQEIAINKGINQLESKWVYVFDGFHDTFNPEGFSMQRRTWQADFTPANDSIFRRMEGVI